MVIIFLLQLPLKDIVKLSGDKILLLRLIGKRQYTLFSAGASIEYSGFQRISSDLLRARHSTWSPKADKNNPVNNAQDTTTQQLEKRNADGMQVKISVEPEVYKLSDINS